MRPLEAAIGDTFSEHSALSDRSAGTNAIRLQILTAEHANLVATRGMVWNEIFTRTGMLLTILSAVVVALALIAQASGFGDTFRVFALLVLPVVLFVGLGTFIRLGDAMNEDARLVAGMNRLRHAYLEMAPELEPYFITSQHDDLPGVMITEGMRGGIRPSRILAGTPQLVIVINAVVAGALVALAAEALGAADLISVLSGVIGGAATLIAMATVPFREIARLRREYRPRFPS
jgi:hypothetical protein